MRKILVLHGPNLNLLGQREPEHYGHTSLVILNDRLVAMGAARGHTVETFQSNWEGALIDRIHAARTETFTALVINPGGLTHTSVALRDALAAVEIPFIEVHMSNVFARESFRHYSYLSSLALGVISGLGPQSYELALECLLTMKERHGST